MNRPVSGNLAKRGTTNIIDFITKMAQTIKAAFQRIVGKGEFISVRHEPTFDALDQVWAAGLDIVGLTSIPDQIPKVRPHIAASKVNLKTALLAVT